MAKAYVESHRSRIVACVTVCLLIVSGAIDCTPLAADEGDNPPPPAANAPSRLDPVFIPEGIAMGMLLHKVEPEFPGIAKAARISGIVTLRATISRAGDIANLRAICGAKILQDASIKAVQQWKYRPYVVHGETVEVETTIRVTFALGGKKKLKFSKDSCPEQ
jgi:TonB family protein